MLHGLVRLVATVAGAGAEDILIDAHGGLGYVGEAARDDARDVSAVSEVVGEGGDSGLFRWCGRGGEVAMEFGDGGMRQCLEGRIGGIAEVDVFGADARVDDSPADAIASSGVGTARGIGFDGGDGTVDQGLDREIRPDAIDGLIAAVRLLLILADQRSPLFHTEEAAEVCSGDRYRRGGFHLIRAYHGCIQDEELCPGIDEPAVV